MSASKTPASSANSGNVSGGMETRGDVPGENFDSTIVAATGVNGGSHALAVTGEDDGFQPVLSRGQERQLRKEKRVISNQERQDQSNTNNNKRKFDFKAYSDAMKRVQYQRDERARKARNEVQQNSCRVETFSRGAHFTIVDIMHGLVSAIGQGEVESTISEVRTLGSKRLVRFASTEHFNNWCDQ